MGDIVDGQKLEGLNLMVICSRLFEYALKLTETGKTPMVTLTINYI